jgi:hypothetical protein
LKDFNAPAWLSVEETNVVMVHQAAVLNEFCCDIVNIDTCHSDEPVYRSLVEDVACYQWLCLFKILSYISYACLYVALFL